MMATHHHLVAKVLFLIFTVAHGVLWHTCKFHPEKDHGACVDFFQCFWVDNTNSSSSSSSHPAAVLDEVVSPNSFWTGLLVLLRQHEEQQQESYDEMKLQQQQYNDYRLELVRELHLALAILCALSIWVKSDTIRTFMLAVESVVFGHAAYNTAGGATAASSVADVVPALPFIVMTMLALLAAFLGLALNLKRDQVIAAYEDPTAMAKESIFTDMTKDTATTVSGSLSPELVQELSAAKVDDVLELDVVPPSCSFGENDTVTATIFKPTKDSTVGISVKKNAADSCIVIGRIHGLCIDTPLQVGQTILSVNGTKTTDTSMTAKEVASMIKDASSDVTIVATKYIRVHAVKPTKESRLGISFSRSLKDEGSFVIRKIYNDSLFRGSCLEEGMRVIAINDKACPSSLTETCQWIKDIDGSVVMLVVKDKAIISSSQQSQVSAAIAVATASSTTKMVRKKVIFKMEQPPESAPPLVPWKNSGQTKSRP